MPGQADQGRLIAHIATKHDAAAPSAGELRQWLSHRIPSYMVPSAVRVLESMPMTVSGKLDRAALSASAADLARAPAEDQDMPRTDDERALAAIWAAVFGLDEVALQQDFFDLGGDSLQAVQVAFRVRENLGLPLTPVDVQMNPSVAELALHLDRLRAAANGTQTRRNVSVR